MNPTDFQLLILKISHDPNRNWLFLTEAVLLVGMYLLRTWGLPRQKTFLQKVGFRLWTLVLYVLLAGFVLPWLWLGDDFVQLIRGMVRGVSQ